ncbi:MAG: serine/threonine-protein kinase, partial [Pseudomonadota bacterium]
MADEEKNTPTSHKADEDHRSDHPLADDPTRFLESGGDDSTRVVPVHKAITERVFGPDGKTRITPVPSHLPADIDATVLRSPKPDDNDTLRVGRPETARRESSDTDLNATILRNSATRTTALMERTRQLNDTDATIHRSDEATLLSQTARVSDTTYIASVGRQIRAQGNSEAGRLLKNRFVLEEKIGSGGMGDVYKALDLRAQAAKDKNPYIAIKLLNENFMRHRDAFISLQREATRTRGIPHENIMAVFDFDAEGTTHYMSMELLDGQPLDDYLRDHSEGVSVEDSWNIINGICNGLSRAHSAGIVHSDFKPGNIFYTESKVAKVFDFGIARAISTSDGLEADGEKTVFDAGSLGALTPTYASYEMLTGKEPTKADDVYAAALVAYELFTGKHPYQRQPADKALKEGLEPEPIPFLKRRQWRALKRGLAIKSGDRCQTIDEFKEGLFSDDPPYFRYGAIALLLIASVSFGLYQSLFQTAPVIPDEVTQLQSVVMVNKGSLEGSLLDMPRIDSPEWHSQVSQALNRLTYADQELLASWPPWDSERTESQLDIGKLQMAILDTYVSEVRAIRTTTKESDQLDLITDLTLKKEEAERQLVQLQE